jgi:aldehyde dehydrogenase (NAD+)
MFNAGQTCLSPDYVLVHRSVQNRLIAEMTDWLEQSYGPNPRTSPDIARIINDRHFDRITRLLHGAGEIVVGGDSDRDARYIAPTIIRDPDPNHPLMNEEVFGPVIAVLGVDSPVEAAAFIAARPQPLSVYAFTSCDDVVDLFTQKTSSGSLVINHVFVHAFNTELPFGGVGESGMGAYTGKHSFDCFTHWKPVMRTRFKPDPSILYPPYSRWKSAIVHRLFC